MLLVDKQPLGVGGELRRGARPLRELGGRAVLGLRDVLDDPAAVRAESTPARVRAVLEHYPRVLVYGNESVFDTLRSRRCRSSSRPALAYCGYVTVAGGQRGGGTDDPRLGDGRSRPIVLATTGGGEDGRRVLETFVEASAGAPWEAIAVTGPQLPRGADEGSRRARARRRRRADVRARAPRLVRRGRTRSCAWGATTRSPRALVRGTPTVCVPRTVPRRGS